MLKSVRVYFNTKRMSAILKALQNRKIEVELKSEVVEFNLVKDFEEQYNKANKETTKAYDGSFAIEKAIDKMLKDYDTAGKSFLKANARFLELENAAKNLGVDLDSKYLAYKKDLSSTLKEIDSASKNLLKAKSMSFL